MQGLDTGTGMKWVLPAVGFGVSSLPPVLAPSPSSDAIALLLLKASVSVVLPRLDWVVDFPLLVPSLLSARPLLAPWRFEREDDCLLPLYNIKHFVFNTEIRKVKSTKKCHFCIKDHKTCCNIQYNVSAYYDYNGISRYFLQNKMKI